MKQSKKLRNFILVILLAVLVGGLVYSKSALAVKGILWNSGLLEKDLLADKVYCFIYPGKCFVKRDELAINFGVYDFNKGFGQNKNLAFDHYFFDWNDSEFIASLEKLFADSAANDRWVLLTIEPYKSRTGEDLFTEIIAGNYDEKIAAICGAVDNSPNPVFLRWGHEMERVTGRYPWAVEDADKFVEGYNYFANNCKTATGNAYYVWSPAGENMLKAYWPGQSNVDYVGLSLYIYDVFELDNYGRIRNFEEAFDERYNRVKEFDRPIVIAEFGISGSDRLQKYWWYNAQNHIENYPLLKTIVYFNAVDTQGVWGQYQTPDWSIDSAVFPGI